MLNSGAAPHWWGEILLTVSYVLNGAPKTKNKVSPYEILKKRQLNLSYIWTWGCLAYARIPNPKRDKLASRVYECVFIGYALNSKAYRFYDLKSKSIIESNDADFYENKFLFKSGDSGGNSGGTDNSVLDQPSEIITSNENIERDVIEPRRGKRARIAKEYGPEYVAYTIEEDPSSIKEALSSIDADLWQEAINDEMDSLMSNETWHLTDLPPGCKTIGCKWILKKKLKLDGLVDKCKACLVVKGFR